MREYLFRIDGASDNDQYINNNTEGKHAVYAGLDLRIGVDSWAPDVIRIAIDDSHDIVEIVLVELESRPATAKISARKYLPESTESIIRAIYDYLDRVIANCKSSADTRGKIFLDLKNHIQDAPKVMFYAAGALRTAKEYLEMHPLLYQTIGKDVPVAAKQSCCTETAKIGIQLLERTCLGAAEIKWLFRTIAIADAVLRKKDSSISTYKSWRAQKKSQPLKVYLKHNGTHFPILTDFVYGRKRAGGSVDMDGICRELSALWSAELGKSVEAEKVKMILAQYSKEALNVKGHHLMQKIFDSARSVISYIGI